MKAPKVRVACGPERRIPISPRNVLPILLVVLGAALCQGQVIIPPPLTQSYTPPALAPGTPAGSYILSDFDTINYGNLSVNFRFPLIKIGGRGTESAVVMPDFTAYSQWTVYPTPAYTNCGPDGCTLGWNYSISRTTPWSPNFLSMYGVPRIGVRQGGFPCSAGASGSLITNYSQNTLSRITFIGPDGTEMELIDQKSGGQPQPYTIGQSGYYDRGNRWVTRDGASAIFTTSGPDVFDTVATASNCSIAPQGINGTLVMRDGTTYTFANTVAVGYATSIADRNGNTITYTYANGSSNLAGITDAAGRSYGVTLGLTDSSSGLKYDLVTYPGGNDVARPIRVYFNSLVNILRADQPQALQSSSVLWPGVVSSSASSTTPEYFPGNFISGILLPDGSSYTFKYDSYGNVARIQLPTGGAVEYDWIGQEEWGAATSPDQIFLRCVLTERREYLSSATGTTPSRITKYTTGTAGIAGGVTVSDYDGTGTICRPRRYTIP